jgi:hypothetical protein
MSIALSNWATNQKIDIAYIDKNDLQIINFTTKKFEQDKLTKQLSINEYLSMYGSYVYENSSAPTDNEIKFVNHLVHYYNDYQLKELHKSYQNNSQIVDNEYITLMNEYNIPEKSQRVLITGRWLEIFIYITLLQKLGDRQVGFGLKLANRHNFPEGEQLEKSKHIIKDYDVIFVYNNKLHIIECKTSIKPEPLDSSSDVLEHMFKLQTLTDPKNFGLFAGKYYATNYAISDNLKSQAEQYGIKHITGFISGQLSLLEKQNKLLTLLDVK